MMRYRIWFSALLFSSFAAAAQGKEPAIIFYNYYTPPPPLEVISLTPQNHQEFSNGSPGGAQVSFSQNIVPEKSAMKAFDPYNNPLRGQMSITNGTKMTLTLPPHLLTGAYRIEWSATCACAAGTVITGTSYFTVD